MCGELGAVGEQCFPATEPVSATGCGKTLIARKLAEVTGFSAFEKTPGDLANIYIHGSQGKIAEIFANARKQAPCMIFFDELDAMVPSRGDTVGHHYASEVNEFLV